MLIRVREGEGEGEEGEFRLVPNVIWIKIKLPGTCWLGADMCIKKIFLVTAALPVPELDLTSAC